MFKEAKPMSTKLRGNVLRVLGTLLPVAMLAGQVFAAEAPAINGYLDTTYMYNFNKPGSQITELRSFDQRANNFSLNAAQIAITGKAGEDAAYVVKLLAGNDA